MQMIAIAVLSLQDLPKRNRSEGRLAFAVMAAYDRSCRPEFSRPTMAMEVSCWSNVVELSDEPPQWRCVWCASGTCGCTCRSGS